MSTSEKFDVEIWKYGKGLLLFIEQERVIEKLKKKFQGDNDKPLLKYNGAFAGFIFPGKLYEELKEYCKKKKFSYKKCGLYVRPEKKAIMLFFENKIIVRFSEKYKEKSDKLKKISGTEWDPSLSAWLVPKENEKLVGELFEKYGNSKRKIFENIFYFVVKTSEGKNSVMFISGNLQKTREFVQKLEKTEDIQILSRVDLSLDENLMILSSLDQFAKVSLVSDSESVSSEKKPSSVSSNSD